MKVVAIAVRAVACALAVLPAATACGGAPKSESMPDSTGAGLASGGASPATPADSSAPAIPSGPAANAVTASFCERPAQGCPCDTTGDVAYCEGPVMRDGTFVTCAGLRLCVGGAWGPCLPQSFTDPGDAAAQGP